jgi:hypothetical protein
MCNPNFQTRNQKYTVMFRQTKRLQQKWLNLVFCLPKRETILAVLDISRELKKALVELPLIWLNNLK